VKGSRFKVQGVRFRVYDLRLRAIYLAKLFTPTLQPVTDVRAKDSRRRRRHL
jgi:hypothetical protein